MNTATRSGGTVTPELRVSAAEWALTRTGHTGRTWNVPKRARTEDEARDLAAVETFVNTVIHAHAPDAGRISVYAQHWDLRHGGAHATTDGLNWVGLAGNEATTLTLLHECAHIIVRVTTGERGHDDAFVQVAARVYREHLGDAAADLFERHAAA